MDATTQVLCGCSTEFDPIGLAGCQAELCAALFRVVSFNSDTDPQPPCPIGPTAPCETYIVDTSLATPDCPNGVVTGVCLGGNKYGLI